MLTGIVLCDTTEAGNRQTLIDHLHVLDHAPTDAVRVTYVDLSTNVPFDERWLEADFVVVHTTIVSYRWSARFFAMHDRISWLTRYTGVVVAMPQDEYDHAHVLDDWLMALRTSLIVSCFDETHRAVLYPRMHRTAQFMLGLTGYVHSGRVQDIRANARPRKHRRVDVFYRARNLSYQFGWLGYIKGQIGVHAPALLKDSQLRLNISTRAEDTLLGARWLATLGASVATLGSQSGSSVLDRRGEMILHLRALLSEQPTLSFDDANSLCEGELSRYEFAALGPRHLEAIMTGTLQLLLEGNYSGLLQPWVHYIPVKTDLSDLHTVADVLRDESLVDRITTQAYDDFVVSGAYSYETFARQLLGRIEDIARTRSTSARHAA